MVQWCDGVPTMADIQRCLALLYSPRCDCGGGGKGLLESELMEVEETGKWTWKRGIIHHPSCCVCVRF